MSGPGVRLKGFAARLLLTRARLVASKGDDASVREAIDMVADFFENNREGTADDLAAMFPAQAVHLAAPLKA